MSDTKTLSSLSKLLKIGLFANSIEWYEFSIYGFLSAVIGQLFFPETSTAQSLIQSLAIFATGYLMRPLGSLFFGYYSDRYGRRTSLRLSLIMMSVPTVLIGLLPTYKAIGYLATGLLSALRLIQGFASGGELPISVCYVFEASPPHYRTLLCCSTSMSAPIGFLCGSAISALLFGCLDNEAIHAWAWRIPFLLGAPLTLWIMSLRREIIETKPSSQFRRELSPNPFLTLLSSERKAIVIGISLVLFSSVGGVYLLSLWMPLYLTHFLQYPAAFIHSMNTLLSSIGILFSFFIAYITRFTNAQMMMKVATLTSVILAYPLFKAMQFASHFSLFFILLILRLPISIIQSIIMETLGTLFASHHRATGLSLVLTLPPAILGGATPLVCTYITHRMGLLFPAFYLIILTLPLLLSIVHLNFKKESVS